MEGTIASGLRSEHGSSLVEVLASMVILLFVMLGTLQLFTMALAVDRVTDAQSEMTTKAHTVVEIIRLVNSTKQDGTGTSGILPLSEGTRVLPRGLSDDGYDFWGPNGFGVIEHNARYEVAYEVTDAGPDWIITVMARPNEGSGAVYLGNKVYKGVRYAAHVPK
jgi:Tfp pilus assembly protein PilV